MVSYPFKIFTSILFLSFVFVFQSCSFFLANMHFLVLLNLPVPVKVYGLLQRSKIAGFQTTIKQPIRSRNFTKSSFSHIINSDIVLSTKLQRGQSLLASIPNQLSIGGGLLARGQSSPTLYCMAPTSDCLGNPELYDPTDTCRPTAGQHVTDTLPTHVQLFLPFVCQSGVAYC